MWSASGTFATMEFALTQIFGTKQRNMLRQKLMGFLMMVLLVIALAITVASDSAAGYLSQYMPFAWVLSFVIGAAVMVMLLVLLYRFVPNRTFHLREVLPGALLAGVLIELLSFGFPLYARYAGSFNTYGAQFGLFFLLATWLYLLSQLLLLGAVFNRFRLGRPVAKSLIASPAEQSHKPERPVDAINRKKAGTSTAAPTSESEPRSTIQRRGLFFLLGLALAGSVVRRRGGRRKRSIAS
jgi:uncharacterized BrkB/YihY/UPF0761 family membrane protein